MRRSLLIPAFLAACVVLAPGVLVPGARAAEAPHVQGIFLVTDFPTVTVAAGETSTLKLKLRNYGLPPQPVSLSVSGLPQGWKAEFVGGSQPIAAAMPDTGEAVNLQLRIDVPAGATVANQTVVLHAEAPGAKAELPLKVSLGSELPASLGLKAKQPSWRGTPKSSFEYQLTIRNDSAKDLVVGLAASAPPGFQASYTEAYGTQEISSIPVEAGQTKDVKMKVQPPSTVAAGDYQVIARVSAESASAETPLTMQISGQAKLRLGGKDGRLSGPAEAGTATPINLVVTNDGSAPAEDIEVSGSPPSDWKTEFEPKKIPALDAGQSAPVQVLLTPSTKAVAGDYMTTFRASAKGDSSSADYRVTVTTSTLWGVVGIGIIAIALLIVVGAVARFGRR
jgi:uncharacterized membrane protein